MMGLPVCFMILNETFTFLKYFIILVLMKCLSLMIRAMNGETVSWSGSLVMVTCTSFGIMAPAKGSF